MIGKNKKEIYFPSRKEYLVYLAMEFIKEHGDYVGVDNSIFYDGTECDSFTLVEDLGNEFDIDLDEM